jgi:hypothetical protein
MAITCYVGVGGVRQGKHKTLHGTKVILINAKDRDSLTLQGAAAFLGQTLGLFCEPGNETISDLSKNTAVSIVPILCRSKAV